MIDSIYEGFSSFFKSKRGGISFGRVTEVRPDQRTVFLRTWGGDESTEDNYIKHVQYISLDASPSGDESMCVPRRGQLGLVFWVDGEPFFLSGIRALDENGLPLYDAQKEDSAPNYRAGDKVFSTAGGNRITIKSSGLIEIFSSEVLKRTYFPTGGQLSDLCRNYRFQCDALTETRENIANTGATLTRTEYRKDMLRTSIIVEEKGFVDFLTIDKKAIGPGIPSLKTVETPFYERTIDITGETITKVQPPTPTYLPQAAGVTMIVSPTGDVSLETGPEILRALSVKADLLGNLTVKIGEVGEFYMDAFGGMGIKNKFGEFSISPAGDIEAKNKSMSKVSIAATGDLEVKDGTGAGLKVGKGMVGLGNSVGEVVAILDELVTALSTCTAAGFGAPIGCVPQMTPLLVKIKAILGGI